MRVCLRHESRDSQKKWVRIESSPAAWSVCLVVSRCIAVVLLLLCCGKPRRAVQGRRHGRNGRFPSAQSLRNAQKGEKALRLRLDDVTLERVSSVFRVEARCFLLDPTNQTCVFANDDGSFGDGVDAETSLSLSLHLYLSSPPLHFLLTLTFGL